MSSWAILTRQALCKPSLHHGAAVWCPKFQATGSNRFRKTALEAPKLYVRAFMLEMLSGVLFAGLRSLLCATPPLAAKENISDPVVYPSGITQLDLGSKTPHHIRSFVSGRA